MNWKALTKSKRGFSLPTSIASLGALVVLGIFLLNFVGLRNQLQAQLPTQPQAPTHSDTLVISPNSDSISQPSSSLLYIASHEKRPVIRRGNIATITQDQIESAVSSEIPLAGDWVANAEPSPNGQYEALNTVFGESTGVLILNLVTGEQIDPTVDGKPLGPGWFLGWTYDSSGILFIAHSGWGIPEGLWIVKVKDEGHKRFEIPEVRVSLAFVSATMAPNGQFILYSFTRGLGRGSEVWKMDADGNQRHKIMENPNRVLTNLTFSPDGTKVAYISLPHTATPFTTAELWVMNPDGNTSQKLSDVADGGHGYAPSWSPDSHYLAFVTRENLEDNKASSEAGLATNNINLADVATGTVGELLPLKNKHNFDPFWSPDSTSLVFVSDMSGADEVWTIKVDGNQLHQLTSDSVDKRFPLWLAR